MENSINDLWEDCKNVFLSFKCDHLEEFLNDIIEIVRKNYVIFQKVSSIQYLDYIMKINVSDYILGTNGDNYMLRIERYMQESIDSLEDIWHILSLLIWDLLVPVTNKICPYCHCDNLSLFKDKKGIHIYEFCENCFYTMEKGKQILCPNNLFPADRYIITKHKYFHCLLNINSYLK